MTLRPPYRYPEGRCLVAHGVDEVLDELGARDPAGEPDVLAPAAQFSDRQGSAALRARVGWERPPDQLRERSETVRRRILSSCAGWPRWPTAEEFYEAVRAPALTRYQRHLVSMWVMEAEWGETLRAWAEEAYTVRELVAAIHRTGTATDRRSRNRELNSLRIKPVQRAKVERRGERRRVDSAEDARKQGVDRGPAG